MKVLTSQNGSTILTLDPMGGANFVGLLDAQTYPKGKVAEFPDAAVKKQVKHAVKSGRGPLSASGIGYEIKANHPFSFCRETDLLSSIKWIARGIRLESVEDGAEVGLKARGRSVTLDLPPKALPTLKAGDPVAVGPTITPKALMNARGVIESIDGGGRAIVEFDPRDIDRIKRATGKNWNVKTRVPLVCLEAM